jgi:hypothetical protein
MDVSLLIDNLAAYLGECAFPMATGAAQTLVKCKGQFIQRGVTLSGEMSEASFASVRQYAETTLATLMTESAARKTFATQESALSETILRMRRQDLQPHQRAALEDTIRCLECGAFRSAIVMGWNFVYDLIRYWVFDDRDRLDAFNLAYGPRNNGEQITEYGQLFYVKENSFLQCCRIAQDALTGFTDKTERTLVNLLDERNSYAHSNYRTASAAKAQAYVEKLIDVYSDRPFS